MTPFFFCSQWKESWILSLFPVLRGQILRANMGEWPWRVPPSPGCATIMLCFCMLTSIPANIRIEEIETYQSVRRIIFLSWFICKRRKTRNWITFTVRAKQVSCLSTCRLTEQYHHNRYCRPDITVKHIMHISSLILSVALNTIIIPTFTEW